MGVSALEMATIRPFNHFVRCLLITQPAVSQEDTAQSGIHGNLRWLIEWPASRGNVRSDLPTLLSLP